MRSLAFQLDIAKLSQISGSSAIQCYCPANGRLLGLVNAITPDGIDRAISKAQAAQVAWAKTTFSQRRKVLRTLLKYKGQVNYIFKVDLWSSCA